MTETDTSQNPDEEHEIRAFAMVEEERVYRKHPSKEKMEFRRVVDATPTSRSMFFCTCGAGKFRKDKRVLEHLREVGVDV